MTETMTLFEYQTASNERRRLATQIMNAELAELRQAIADRKTEQGKLEARRLAQVEAARLLELARQADRLAHFARITRESTESQALGRARLEAAAHEARTTKTLAVRRKHNEWEKRTG